MDSILAIKLQERVRRDLKIELDGKMFVEKFTIDEVLKQIKAVEKQKNIICPHCQERGGVTTEQVSLKRGISGTKAAAALLTGGISILGTGLSQKEDATQATCSHCGSVWHY